MNRRDFLFRTLAGGAVSLIGLRLPQIAEADDLLETLRQGVAAIDNAPSYRLTVTSLLNTNVEEVYDVSHAGDRTSGSTQWSHSQFYSEGGRSWQRPLGGTLQELPSGKGGAPSAGTDFGALVNLTSMGTAVVQGVTYQLISADAPGTSPGVVGLVHCRWWLNATTGVCEWMASQARDAYNDLIEVVFHYVFVAVTVTRPADLPS